MSKAFALVMVLAGVARADNQCHVLDVELTPAEDHIANAQLHLPPQIVVWLEDAQGNYVETLYITQATGTYGLGNRPGRFDVNTAPLWPYGRRVTTFPVWAHKDKPELAATGTYPFPELEFQDGIDNNLSHSTHESSTEPHFCRPVGPNTGDPRDEQYWQNLLDTGTCASPPMTDKGVFSPTKTTGYPPRIDVTRQTGIDSVSVDMFPLMNPFDGVSQATPKFGETASVTWPIPSSLPLGQYTIYVEVSKELDFNATYNPTSYPSPTDIIYGSEGVPYRGQPSVIYRIPIAIGAAGDTVATTADIAGYGDPDGLDGNIRPPDDTISTDTPGSGGARLQLISDAQGMYRVLVDAVNVDDNVPPAAAANGTVVTAMATSAQLTFVAPADDTGMKVRGYDIRYRAMDPITDDNFAASTPVMDAPKPGDPGAVQTLELDGLLPQTDYYVGIRAFDECHNNSPITVIHVTTADNTGGEVDACFVATAAYGSVMANDVGMLRGFRDRMLRNNVLGELFVETYYTFGPALANVVDKSDALRSAARTVLGPLVDVARATAR